MNQGSKRQILVGILGACLGAAAVLLLSPNEPRPSDGARDSAAESGDAGESPETAATSDAGTSLDAPVPPDQVEVHAKPLKPAPARRALVNSRSRVLELEQLQALGYLDGTYDPEPENTGVLLHRKGQAQPGLNFYSSRKMPGARLIDMEGQSVHEWQAAEKGAWQHAELLPNGDVIVIVKDKRLSRYDKDSKLLWTVRGRFHHDMWIANGEIYVLARKGALVEYIHPRITTLVDWIQVRSLDGELKREISVLDAIHESVYGFLLPSVSHRRSTSRKRQLDVLHTNHIEVFDGSLADRGAIYAKGNILISMRNINSIAILDGETSEVLWIWGPTNLTFQHHPSLLDSGNIMLFDNGLERSRVIEIDPLSGKVVWSYAPSKGFFSKTRGSNQRLANGNTLITESDRGYVIEVTPRRQLVWKFANPRINRKSEREAIWRMTRVDPELLGFLD